ncbi:MAG: four helix bundle protein [Candidatus Omnitrophica bacterium]|nr:four helix bundle protein [Candidatus Omnitrophota bacterium]
MQNPKIDRETFKEEFKNRIYNFILRLIKFIDMLPRDVVCRVIADQLMRSGASIGANYFEARAASSKIDFTNYFNHSLKSSNESKFWLSILIDAKKCNTSEAEDLLKEVSEIANIFASSILTLKGKK